MKIPFNLNGDLVEFLPHFGCVDATDKEAIENAKTAEMNYANRMGLDFSEEDINEMVNRRLIDWRDNYTFTDTLEFVSYFRSGSTAGAYWKDNASRKYYMFLGELFRIMPNVTIFSGAITGTWTFRKQGQKYSICMVD
jgi:hypothetical protein